MAIQVLLVEDHPMTRTGLGVFLKAFPDLELIGEVASGEEALAACAERQPDVILMDMKMPGMDGIEATRQVKRLYPRVRVIALTSFQEGSLVEQALQAGAISYLLKNVTATDLAWAIRAAHDGRPVLAPEATEALIQTVRRQTVQDFALTQREQEVLQLLVAGLSNADIAEQLNITRSTVKFHVGGILSKLGASSRAEAVTIAWQNHLVS